MYINNADITRLVHAAFPDYNGRRTEIEPFTGPRTTQSYWCEGHRDYWALVNLITWKSFLIPENGTPFVNKGRSFRVGRLPENVALIRWSRGRYERVTIYLHPANFRADMIQAPGAGLTWAQTVVLVATRNLKNTHGGRTNIRFASAHEETSITTDEWRDAQAQLISMGLLRSNGSITDEGRNRVPFNAFNNLSDAKLKRPVPAVAEPMPLLTAA